MQPTVKQNHARIAQYLRLVIALLPNVCKFWQVYSAGAHGEEFKHLSFSQLNNRLLQVKMLRESEPNAVKRMLKFLEDYDKCTQAQRDQVFLPENEESIIRLFVGALAVFKKHHSKSKAVSLKDVAQSLKLLDLLRDRSPRALGSRWETIRVHVEAFLDEALPLDIKQAAFSLLFSILDTSILPELKRSDFSPIEDLFCRSFHWPNSYRLRVEPTQPCEFLPRTNQLTENWDTFSLLFRSFIDMCLDSKANHEVLWWFYMKDKILSRFPLSVSERVAGTPLPCPVPVAECLVQCVVFGIWF